MVSASVGHVRLRRRIRLRIRDTLLLRAVGDARWSFREDIARRYVRGDGVEIGALHRPLRVLPTTRVRYVDVMSRIELLERYTSAVYGNPAWVVDPDIIDDCERLRTFCDDQLDFVIANHVLEHTEDPIRVLQHLVRVLRPGGVLLLTLPDARYTFDAGRRRTSVRHVLRDHELGPKESRNQHYREWATVEGLQEHEVDCRVAEFARTDARHHFHVWELETFLDLLRTIELPARLELAQQHRDEFCIVMRRCMRPSIHGITSSCAAMDTAS
jgi:predicted SAM-dependent methyltransferase